MALGAKGKPDNEEKVVMTVCNSHCGGTCPLKLHIKEGVITRIETGDQSRACLKGRTYRQRVYAPDRLLYPLRRVGERGKGEFERISWDEALDTVATEIKRIRESYGPSAVLLFYSVGDAAHLHNAGLIENLLARTGGYSGTWGCASCEGGTFAARMTYGVNSRVHTPDDLLNSRLIMLWGWNPVATSSMGNNNLYLARAREAGVRIVAVDPRYTDSVAAFADQWIPIRPGTDAAMLIAMAYVIITENLVDQIFLDRYTIGFDRFKEYVLGKEDGVSKTPVWAEDITGVPATMIANLAREYATNRPAALMDGFAPGRTAYGEEYHRAAIALAAMTGNIGIHGGSTPGDGASYGLSGPYLQLGVYAYLRMKSANNPVDQESSSRRDALWYNKLKEPIFYWGGPSSARVNRHNIADAILKGQRGGYPADYKLLYVVNCNYLNQYANTNKIIQALKKLEFVVVQEQFMTATAKFADIVLPTNTFMERNDLCQGGTGLFYGYMNKAIDSLGESKSHYEIATELATRLGISDYGDKTEEEWLREIVGECKDIPDYDTFKEQGIHEIKLQQPFVCFEKEISDPLKNPFPTPSGKIEIYSQEIADNHNPLLPPIPKYIESWESRDDHLAIKYPLQLITIHARRRAHTQFDNIPWLRELYPQAISINATDAQVRGIKDGDMVKIFNDRGQMIITANVSERIMPGVVSIPQGAWYNPDVNGVDRGGCVNILTKDGVGPGAAFPTNTALVQVERHKGR
ncbi:molybdopterin-dependent oxidoreductase [Chloroflexota bacterium]